MAQTSSISGSNSTNTLPEKGIVSSPMEAENAPSIAKRLVALDAFRGVTIFIMLLVNNVALDTRTPPELMHAGWNLGLRLADMVFPWFLFCVGVALPYSRASFARSRKSQSLYLGKAFLRGGSLVVIGALLDSAINHHLAFSLGVLQLIGLAYFVAAVAYEARPWFRALFATALLVSYGFAIRHLSYPGGATGVFGETNNWVIHFNNAYLTRYDLRGLMSTVPTAALVLYGTLIGDILREQHANGLKRLAGIVASAVGLMAVGDVWSVFLPYNKPFWTPSYILVAGGFGALLLGATYVIVDLGKQRWIAYPFRVFGSNAIAAYVVPILFKVMIFEVVLVQTASGSQTVQKAILDWLKGSYGSVGGGWAYTGLYIFFWWVVLWILYRRKLFLRV
jgi:predicted acyltransferase